MTMTERHLLGGWDEKKKGKKKGKKKRGYSQLVH